MKTTVIFFLFLFLWCSQDLTAQEGCTGTASISVTIEDCTAVNDIPEMKIFEVSPNPADGWISVHFQTSSNMEGRIRIFDSSSKELINEPAVIQGEMTKRYDLSASPAGTYWVVFYNNNKSTCRKLLIE